MTFGKKAPLVYKTESITARFLLPSGETADKRVETRLNPVTFRTSRITYARADEKEPGTDTLPPPPPNAENRDLCPFCRPQVLEKTPMLHPDLSEAERLVHGKSVLFPNLFPYGSFSAVSLFDDRHFVEIGRAEPDSYRDCLINCANYFSRILSINSDFRYMAITQNHLPSAGGSLLHPHLQVQVDRVPANNHRFLESRCETYFQDNGSNLFSDYLDHEKQNGKRYIGKTGQWEWVAAFAPEGFYEIWGILPGYFSLAHLSEDRFEELASGIIRTQKFYRSLCRNGYNLGILSIEKRPGTRMELRCVILARSNYAPWTRNDHTGFELMLGDMATFSSPEDTAGKARPFFLS